MRFPFKKKHNKNLIIIFSNDPTVLPFIQSILNSHHDVFIFGDYTGIFPSAMAYGTKAKNAIDLIPDVKIPMAANIQHKENYNSWHGGLCPVDKKFVNDFSTKMVHSLLGDNLAGKKPKYVGFTTCTINNEAIKKLCDLDYNIKIIAAISKKENINSSLAIQAKLYNRFEMAKSQVSFFSHLNTIRNQTPERVLLCSSERFLNDKNYAQAVLAKTIPSFKRTFTISNQIWLKNLNQFSSFKDKFSNLEPLETDPYNFSKIAKSHERLFDRIELDS